MIYIELSLLHSSCASKFVDEKLTFYDFCTLIEHIGMSGLAVDFAINMIKWLIR